MAKDIKKSNNREILEENGKESSTSKEEKKECGSAQGQTLSSLWVNSACLVPANSQVFKTQLFVPQGTHNPFVQHDSGEFVLYQGRINNWTFPCR